MLYTIWRKHLEGVIPAKFFIFLWFTLEVEVDSTYRGFELNVNVFIKVLFWFIFLKARFLEKIAIYISWWWTLLFSL